jgi:hypothetical protein
MQLFLTAFESVPDPRADNVRHDLVEILLIAFLAVRCAALLGNGRVRTRETQVP